jgi:hypothetical protein
MTGVPTSNASGVRSQSLCNTRSLTSDRGNVDWLQTAGTWIGSASMNECNNQERPPTTPCLLPFHVLAIMLAHGQSRLCAPGSQSR